MKRCRACGDRHGCAGLAVGMHRVEQPLDGACEKPLQLRLQTLCVFFEKIVLPNPKHPPALRPQRCIHQAVAVDVAVDFVVPERGVAFRAGAVLGASMPEAAVHEYSDFLFPEYEVRFSEQGLFPAPAGDSVQPKKRDQHEFGGLVAVGADARHDLGALGFRKDVCHAWGVSWLVLVASTVSTLSHKVPIIKRADCLPARASDRIACPRHPFWHGRVWSIELAVARARDGSKAGVRPRLSYATR